MVTLANDAKALQGIILKLEEEMKEYGINIDSGKINVMKINKRFEKLLRQSREEKEKDATKESTDSWGV